MRKKIYILLIMAIILGCKDNRDKNIDTTQFKIQN